MRDEVTFGVEQTADPDGLVRLSLVGELDHVGSEGLLRQLGERKAADDPVRLDLSGLQFIDSSGVRAILVSVRDARRDGWHFEVDRKLSWQVEHVFDVLGVGSVVWPDGEAAS